MSVRIKKLADLSAELIDLERREVSLLLLDSSTLPRPDCSPLAYLQLEIREAAAAAA
jgi:hypothetical protein